MHAPALLFPGQGAQEPGMGRDLADASPDAAYIWKQAEQASSLPLRAVFWEGTENDMADTRALQPALAAAELALWGQIAPKVRPCAGAGHSLGEYCCLAAADVLPLKSVLELVSLRGRLMAEADPENKGTMCAVLKLDEAHAEDVVRKARERSGEDLRIANYNTPAQFVLSGGRAAVAAAADIAKEHKGRAVPLKVSGALHSPFMAEAAAEFAKYLRALTWNKPRFPIYCNALGRAVGDGEGLKEAMLIQMTSSVFWTRIISAQWEAGIRRWLEIGPKSVLSGMTPRILSTLHQAQEAEYTAEALCSAEDVRNFNG